MKYLILIIIFASSVFSAEIVSREKVMPGIEIMKILYEGHSYLYFYNHWNTVASAWEHDPECLKCKSKNERKN